MRRFSREQWEQIVNEQAASGLSIKEFCRQKEISLHRPVPKKVLEFCRIDSDCGGSGVLPKNWSSCYESLKRPEGQGDS